MVSGKTICLLIPGAQGSKGQKVSFWNTACLVRWFITIANMGAADYDKLHYSALILAFLFISIYCQGTFDQLDTGKSQTSNMVVVWYN